MDYLELEWENRVATQRRRIQWRKKPKEKKFERPIKAKQILLQSAERTEKVVVLDADYEWNRFSYTNRIESDDKSVFYECLNDINVIYQCVKLSVEHFYDVSYFTTSVWLVVSLFSSVKALAAAHAESS